ncbi:hypothetical protein Q8F55_004724 [Vanrija albida]|uniref:TauD/TfdA-like domain-containing protein n=1 Tax=Vanrija albida TaxID=181172 RepID=A0ABR3Q0L0_9TREE
MSPIAVEQTPDAIEAIKAGVAATTIGDVKVDLRSFASFDTAPSIGTEFPAASIDGKPALDIRAVLEDPEKQKALAKLVSERGVVFFRNAILSPEEQKDLVTGLGRQSGKPATSGLHIHPLTFINSKDGDEVTVISNEYRDATKKVPVFGERRLGKTGWHSDITFEPIPSDYATLQLRTVPKVGGDTLWASAYEAYDRLSPSIQTLLEGYTAVHDANYFKQVAAARGEKIRDDVRGAPDNVGDDLKAVHPVIRTNPVTGWKGLFVNRGFTKRIVEVSAPESDALLEFLFEHVTANHDLQTRFRWEENSLAIWDNRSTFHTATQDLGDQKRTGTRSVSLGERPYFDPKSQSRRKALGIKDDFDFIA